MVSRTVWYGMIWYVLRYGRMWYGIVRNGMDGTQEAGRRRERRSEAAGVAVGPQAVAWETKKAGRNICSLYPYSADR